MPEEDREVVLNALRDNRLDCIVQEQMLGEGFDHPRLSVADYPKVIEVIGNSSRSVR